MWSGSLALASDAGTCSRTRWRSALAAGAAWLARRPRATHSYGLARAEVIGATLNGLLMLGIIVVLVVEAVQRLLAPRPVMAGAVIVDRRGRSRRERGRRVHPEPRPPRL